jgi:hypothetical protein
MKNLTDIAVFIQVVDSGSFTNAADRLGVSRAVRPNVWRFTAPEGRELAVPISGNLCANNGLAEREAALHGLGVMMSPTFMKVVILARH